MKVVIASRIFEPEPSAASFRLAALADALAGAGHEVTVLTVKPSRSQRDGSDRERQYSVKRFPVLRDATGYVRGYLQYLSFDIPLFFRVLFGQKYDLLVAEPPPTTGLVVRAACALRRIPYAYYAADVWSDASESTGAPGIVVKVVRRMERFALRGARRVLSVNDGVTRRLGEIAPDARVHTVGNGVDVDLFAPEGTVRGEATYFLYAGTASEWQGASIFIDAFATLVSEYSNARLVFLGSGSDWPALKDRASKLPAGTVEFVPTVSPAEAAVWLRGAVASVASIRPDSGYSFAFPTKVFASWATGTPVIFAGGGSTADFMELHQSDAELGAHCNYDAGEVLEAMRKLFANPFETDARMRLGHWAEQRVSLRATAERAVRALQGADEESTV